MMERAAWILLLFVTVLIAVDSREPKRPEISSREAEQFGFFKLDGVERAAVEAWLGYRISVEYRPPELPVCPPCPSDPSGGEVVFNTNSRKYHCPDCSHARQCTRNCIPLSLREAKERGGKACGNCGGCD